MRGLTVFVEKKLKTDIISVIGRFSVEAVHAIA
jgi:hypothetical protein